MLPSFGKRPGQEPRHASQNHPLLDVPGGFNHMSIDSEHQRLFVTATTKKTVEIIDLKAGKPLRSLTGDGPAAALFAPEFSQLYVTRGHNVCIFDGTSFDLLTIIPLDTGLDELQYAPNAKRLYVGCMTSNKTAIAVIAIPGGKVKGEIKLTLTAQTSTTRDEIDRRSKSADCLAAKQALRSASWLWNLGCMCSWIEQSYQLFSL